MATLLMKSHLPIKYKHSPKIYACRLCIAAGRTVTPGQATIFPTDHQLTDHIAWHPSPLPQVPGLVILEVTWDKFKKIINPRSSGTDLVLLSCRPSPIRIGLQGGTKTSMLERAVIVINDDYTWKSCRHCASFKKLTRLPPGQVLDQASVHHEPCLDCGIQRISGCCPGSSSKRYYVPVATVRLLLPQRTSGKGYFVGMIATAEHDFLPSAGVKVGKKLKIEGAGKWLEIRKGETITDIRCRSPI